MYREMNIEEDVAWGTILADAVRHIAKALSEVGEESESNLLRRIQVQFNAELGTPSASATGSFVQACLENEFSPPPSGGNQTSR